MRDEARGRYISDPDNIRGMTAGYVQPLNIPARYVWGIFAAALAVSIVVPVVVCAIVVIVGG